MTVSNARLSNKFSFLLRFPLVLQILRWIVFWVLETGLSQFWNDSRGRAARENRLAFNQRYMERSAPGMFLELIMENSLTYSQERYWPLLTPEHDLGCKVIRICHFMWWCWCLTQRRILDNHYLSSLHDPKMALVQDSIQAVGANSVTTTSGHQYQVDFIVSSNISLGAYILNLGCQ